MASRTYTQRCLVLRKTKLGETDAILTLLGSDGHQVRAVAKGLRRPGSRFGARLEPFSEVDLLLHAGRNLDVLSEARSVHAHAACREELGKSAAASVLAEFLSRTTREASVEGRVYELAAVGFSALDTHGEEHAGLLAAACLSKAFALLGFGPALRNCAVCARPVEEVQGFDVSVGGVLCAECRTAPASLSDTRLVAWLALLMHTSLDALAGIEDAPVRVLLEFCELWAREHLAIELRSLAFLKTLC